MLNEVTVVQPVLEGELLEPGQGTVYVAVQDPFKGQLSRHMTVAGLSVTEILEQVIEDPKQRLRATVFIEGHLAYHDLWHRIRPKADTRVAISLMPAGKKKKGSGSVFSILGALAMIAASILLPELLPGIAFWGISWGTLAAGAVTLIGGFLMNTLMGKPKAGKMPKLSSTASSDSPTLFISGTQNEARPYGVKPRVLGRHKVVPPYAAKAFTRIQGDDQFVTVSLHISKGPCKIEAEKLGETLLSNYKDVKTEFFRGYLPSQINEVGAWDPSLGAYPDPASFGDRYTVEFITSGGPTGIPGGFYLISVDANTLKLSDTKAHALAGTNVIDITAAGTAVFEMQFVLESLFTAAVVNTGTDTVNIPAHGYSTSWGPFQVSVTGSATLDSGLVAGKNYWLIVTDANNFAFAESKEKALAGTKVPLNADGTGQTHLRATWPAIKASASDINLTDNTITVPTHNRVTGEGPYALVVTGITVDGRTHYIGDTITYNGLGNTALTSSWDYNQDKPSKLVPARISEQPFQIALTQPAPAGGGAVPDDAGWQLRTTTNCTKFSIDVSYLQGLVFINSAGGKNDQSVEVEVRYAPAGTTTWSAITTIKTTAHLMAAVRDWREFEVPEGVYDVQVRRKTVDSSSTQVVDQVWWTALRSILPGDPFPNKTDCIMILDIRASDQLNGVVDNYNCIATSILWDYDYTDGFYKWRPTRNNSACFVEVFTGPGLGTQAVTYDRLDMSNLEDFHDWCRTNNFNFDMVIDFDGAIGDVLDDICQAARASKQLTLNGKWGVVIERPQGAPVHKYMERNIWDFTWRRPWMKVPTAYLVRFINADADFKQDMREVRADDFDPDNPKYQTLEFPGVTSSDIVYRLARFMLAIQRLRPVEYSHTCDLGYMIGPRGSLVTLQHTSILSGHGSARITDLTTDDDGNVTEVRIDDSLFMELGKRYGIVIYSDTNPVLGREVVNNTIEPHQLVLTVPIPAADATDFDIGALVTYGELGLEEKDVLVKATIPQSGIEMNAMVVTCDYSPAVYTADTEVIPEWTSVLSSATGIEYPPILQARANEEVLVIMPDLSWYPIIMLTMGNPMSHPSATGIEIRYRIKGTIGPYEYVTAPLNASSITLSNVEQGITYTIEARYSTANQPGQWGPIIECYVVGATNPPHDITEVDEENGFMKWANYVPPRDIRGYYVKYLTGNNFNWDAGILAHSEPYITAKQFDLSVLPFGTVTIMVKPVDLAYNESINAVGLILDLGDPIVANVVDTIDVDAMGYPGTYTDCHLDGGDLVADEVPTDYLPINNDIYLADDGAEYLPVTYKAMSYEYTMFVDPSWPTAKIILDLTTVGSANVQYVKRMAPEYAIPDGDPYADPDGDPYAPSIDDDGSPFLPWPGQIYVDPSFSAYLFRVNIGGGSVQSKITNFDIIIDGDDESEEIENFAISNVGTPTLPITRNYWKIKTINFTALNATQAITITVDHPISTTAPVVRAYNNAGRVAINVNATVQGIKGD